jgi:XTP/dITP diphosphohydrolase
MKDLVIVTGNKGKLAEARAIAKEYGVELRPPRKELKLEIQTGSLKEVAEFAAKNAYRKIRKPLIIDDSGIFINALKGFPGVYSASVGKTIGMEGILKLMKGVKDRSAYFECAVTYFDGKTMKTFVGRADGKILDRRIDGPNGFGYDPVFSVGGKYGGESLARVDILEKNKVSHRGKALRAFFKWYSNAK